MNAHRKDCSSICRLLLSDPPQVPECDCGYERIATLTAELEALKKAARDILDGKRSHSLSRRTVTNTSLLKMAALLGDK